MPALKQTLELDRCPHCSVANPYLPEKNHFTTQDANGENTKHWKNYVCSRCGGAVLACAKQNGGFILEVHPTAAEVDSAIGSPAHDYLQQAIESLHAPAGAVMLAASAVDAMLKAKGYTKGSLYSRIDKAADDGVITGSMAEWAHEVRLDANDPRHADKENPLPTVAGAKKAVEFTRALGQFLFVLPARIERGLEKAKSPEEG